MDSGKEEDAVTAIVGFAEIAFEIPPFKPKSLPLDWKQILEQWQLGAPFVRSTPTWSEINEVLARSYAMSEQVQPEPLRLHQAGRWSGRRLLGPIRRSAEYAYWTSLTSLDNLDFQFEVARSPSGSAGKDMAVPTNAIVETLGASLLPGTL